MYREAIPFRKRYDNIIAFMFIRRENYRWASPLL